MHRRCFLTSVGAAAASTPLLSGTKSPTDSLQPPRKVIAGTVVQSFWGDYPGIDKRLNDLAGIVDRVAALSQTRYGRGLDLAILPEVAVTGELGADALAHAASLDGPLQGVFARTARQHRCYIVVECLGVRAHRPDCRADPFTGDGVGARIRSELRHPALERETAKWRSFAQALRGAGGLPLLPGRAAASSGPTTLALRSERWCAQRGWWKPRIVWRTSAMSIAERELSSRWHLSQPGTGSRRSVATWPWEAGHHACAFCAEAPQAGSNCASLPVLQAIYDHCSGPRRHLDGSEARGRGSRGASRPPWHQPRIIWMRSANRSRCRLRPRRSLFPPVDSAAGPLRFRWKPLDQLCRSLST